MYGISNATIDVDDQHWASIFKWCGEAFEIYKDCRSKM